ncbi:hypothetical protein V7S43_003931 [Phytophthora oleae]|uniref:Uncharacterized protein n=1 Tax=Phytophthora oleae TaxID=2107226 RepID=A0ABD3FV03_9STRA
MFVLHPDKLTSVKRQFGDDAASYCASTATAFSVLWDGLSGDTDFRPQNELDEMTDVEYSNERRRVRKAQEAKDHAEATFMKFRARYSLYKKKIDRYVRARDRSQNRFQVQRESAQEERDKLTAKLKKIIAEIEAVGPCSTFEEVKESYKQRNNSAAAADE